MSRVLGSARMRADARWASRGMKAARMTGYIAPCHGHLRDVCLNVQPLVDVAEAQVRIEAWRQDDDHHRRHGSPAELTLIQYMLQPQVRMTDQGASQQVYAADHQRLPRGPTRRRWRTKRRHDQPFGRRRCAPTPHKKARPMRVRVRRIGTWSPRPRRGPREQCPRDLAGPCRPPRLHGALCQRALLSCACVARRGRRLARRVGSDQVGRGLPAVAGNAVSRTASVSGPTSRNE